MKAKLHAPDKKKGSGVSSLKQFLLSLLATTVSIALTFGTAAIIDHNKQQKEKRQIVMMVMYDMYNSLRAVEKADSSILQSMEIQRQLAEDTTRFDDLRYQMAFLVPRTNYTETTEHIFSSSIETINTVGNVVFTETVAAFYQNRRFYKTMVSDPVFSEVQQSAPLASLKGILDFDYSQYAMTSNGFLKDMQHQYALCRQMMAVTDEEIESYRKEREQIDKSISEEEDATDAIFKILRLQKSIDAAKAKLKMK